MKSIMLFIVKRIIAFLDSEEGKQLRMKLRRLLLEKLD